MRRAWPPQRSEEAEAKSGERSSVVFVEDKNGTDDDDGDA